MSSTGSSGLPRGRCAPLRPTERAGRRYRHGVRTRVGWIVAGALLLGLHNTTTRALDDVTLVWKAPRECPGRDAVLARIAARLPSQHGAYERWHAEGRVTRDGARYRLEMVLRSAGGEARREVGAATCSAIADLAALLIALALDPNATQAAEPAPGPEPPTAMAEVGTDATSGKAGPSRPPPAPAEAEASPASTVPSASTVPAADDVPTTAPTTPVPNAATPAHTESRRGRRSSPPPADAQAANLQDANRGARFGFGLGAAIAVDSGMLPSAPALGVEPQLELRYGRARASAGLGLWLARPAAAENYPRATLDGRGLLGQLSLGFELLDSPFVLAPRVVLERGVLVLKADGITFAESDSLTWTAAGGGLQAAYRLGSPLEVVLTALALAPFSRPRGRVATPSGEIEVFAAAPVTVRVSAGLAYVFQ